MKTIRLKIILVVNVLLWTILSGFNYISIIGQINKDHIKIIIWSPLIIIMYGLILYTSSIVVARLYNVFKYHKIKAKYMNSLALIKQTIMLFCAVIVVYGLCYYNSNFMGIIPIILFFSKSFLRTGKFYVYHNDMLILFDDKSSEYIVKSLNALNNRIVVQDKRGSKLKTVLLNKNKIKEEATFLKTFLIRESDTEEVA